jgi:signal-transduction protein with cAMP-binding, CBS, and nucleotidyltransferase domain
MVRLGKNMELRDLLGEPPSVILKTSSTAMDAISAMVENDTRSVLIDRDDPQDSFGILTTRDIINEVVAKGLDPSQVLLRDICSKPLVAANNLDVDMRWVAKKMANEGVVRLAVYEGKDLKCLVSDIEILKAVAKELECEPREEPSEEHHDRKVKK